MSSISQIGALMKLSFEHYDYCLDLYKDAELRRSFIVEGDGRKSPTRKRVVLAFFLLLSRHPSGEIENIHENSRVEWSLARIQCQVITVALTW